MEDMKKRVLAYGLAVEISNEELESVTGGSNFGSRQNTLEISGCYPDPCDISTDHIQD
ncbi:TPA: hypothetical protein ACPSKE_001074 [Legionella feeleii]|uniref:Uncharacterized protein n=1 Tax=Legionella feeleii TaxID=453 RepID=A0A0W0TLE4_9GAMM|nr:hypothetical protein [Legionella feeleii]KTC96426.1 hypothetical protein Lfee_2224 [Legionella feeleii]SPX61809.1 Uncharacterised protein [Legionella feeleii]